MFQMEKNILKNIPQLMWKNSIQSKQKFSRFHYERSNYMVKANISQRKQDDVGVELDKGQSQFLIGPCS